MLSDIKNPKFDLRTYYLIFLETGLILSLLLAIGATKINITSGDSEVVYYQEQEVTQMDEVVQTEHENRPPPPPRPQVPVEVPNSEVIEDHIINLDAELDFDEPLDLPPAPPEKAESKDEEDFFIVVEQMPKLKGSLADLQKKIKYPELARKANIQGRVSIQFVVNEDGKVEDARVLRGIGGGCDEEALRVVKLAEFEPGRQRGKPVRVQYTLPFIFKLRR